MEDRNRKIFQHAAIGMLVLDLNGHILDFNPAASRMMGPERGLIHKRYLGEFFGDKFGQTLPEKLKLLDQLGHLTLEGRLPGRHQAATEVLLDLTQVPWEEDGQAVLVLMHEITARENIERELQLQRRILATGFSARGDAKAPARMLFLVGPKGDAEPFPPEPPGSPLEEIARHFQSPDLLGAVARTLETGRQTLGPLWLDPADPAGDPGRVRGLARCLRFDLSSMPGEADRVLAIVEDRTFERLAEEDLRRHDQRAVMSLFSGALFHEFNNYLGVILSQASALRLSTPAGRLVPPSVGAILDAAQKAAGLLRRTTEAGYDSGAGWMIFHFNHPVAEAARMLQHLLPPTVKVKLDLGDALPKVFGDPALVRAMVLALGRQAEAHMPAGGDLSIRTRRVDPSSPASPISAELTIGDTGVGMDAMTRAQVIDSLLPVSGGAGDTLDLALARAVILQHRGRVELESATGRGTNWTITIPGQESRPRLTGPAPGQGIPLDDEAGEQQLAQTAAQAMPAAPFAIQNAFDSGARANIPRMRVLLADDEENFRDFVRTILQQNGYEVMTASDGLEAFEHFQEEPEKITLAILDAYMPRLGGLETYLRMQALRPDLPVIFVSGFVRGPSRQALLAACPGRAQVLLKPFTSEQLLQEAGKILETVWSKHT